MAMVFWLIIAAIALSVTGILVAAARTSTSDHELRGGAESDIAVYKDQLAEIETRFKKTTKKSASWLKRLKSRAMSCKRMRHGDRRLTSS